MLQPDAHDLLAERLRTRMGTDRVLTDDASSLAFGTDAGFYRLLPRIVVQAETIDEVVALVRDASQLGTPLTFRAAGTSLSGQAITDSVLVQTSRHWTSLAVLDDGARLRVQPGVVGRAANAALAPYGRRIGPDPASINAAMIGGIVANNASGMCCGTAQNSYQTLASVVAVFADGTILDTGDEASIAAFRRYRNDLVDRIDELATATKADDELARRIHHKFATKNTMGYSLNALVDFDDPIDVIEHLLVGSEGTLAFLAEVVFDTVPDPAHKASALALFPSIADACTAVTLLADEPVSAVELMDRASLRAVDGAPGVPDFISGVHDDVAALLIEVVGETPDELEARLEVVQRAIVDVPVTRPAEFSDDPAVYGGYWGVRKGLFPAVGAVREIGTTVIIEDVTFPVGRLAEATLDLQALFRRHGYADAVIFGHALEGNLHFVVTQDFGDDTEIQRYARFMNELAELVIDRYDGALKAEHGTGRNMAPFLEREWGARAVGLMKDIKDAFDPAGILNPGVILNESPTAHLEHLKPLPAADPLVDTCIECGFCETSCISHDFTYSPRQRIVLQREIGRLRGEGAVDRANELEREIAYGFDATCATDGLCATACPVGIDTGKLVKAHRAAQHRSSPVPRMAAERLGVGTSVARVALRSGHVAAKLAGDRVMDVVATNATRLLGRPTHWVDHMPPAGRRPRIGLQPVSREATPVVYFTSCVNRIFGPDPDVEAVSVFERTVNVLNKADFRVVLPDDIDAQCCGLSFSSHGHPDAATVASDRLAEALRRASNDGEHPILSDMSPCTYEARTVLADRGIVIHDLVDFTTTWLFDRLEFHRSDEAIALFPVCSVKKMGLADDLRRIGERCTTTVHVPESNCCGFAGDRGMLQPELNAWGLRNVAASMPDEVTAGYSTSRTCEVGLNIHAGRAFGALIGLIDDHTSPRATERI